MVARHSDIGLLTRLAEEIEREIDRIDLDVLIDWLRHEANLRIYKNPKGDGLHHANMAGVKATATSGKRHALTNWANAARRAVRKAEAA